MRYRVLATAAYLAVALALAACAGKATYSEGEKTLKQYAAPPEMTIDIGKKYQATLHTTKGDITLDLFASEAPRTVNNFVFLARDHFYDGVKFHRIIKGFMIQSGDPRGDGTGGPGYRFEDEPVTRDYIAGTIAMANAGRNTNGSQFFIMHKDYDLAKNYTIFGIVSKGMNVVDKIASTRVVAGRGGEISTPTENVLIKSIDIRESAK